MSKAVARRKRPPKAAHDPASQSRRPFHGDLLTENRARREFETIPTAWDAKTRLGLNVRSQQGIGPETLHDGRPICIQIEHTADLSVIQKSERGSLNCSRTTSVLFGSSSETSKYPSQPPREIERK